MIQGPGPTFCLAFTEAKEITDYRSNVKNVDESKLARFRDAMLERGVRLNVSGQWYVSTAHTVADVEKTLVAADEALSLM